VYIANRTPHKAEALCAQFSCAACPVRAVQSGGPAFYDTARRVKIIVNTTSLGMKAGDALPIEPELIQPSHSVVDIVYNPWETPLLQAARRAGARTQNGFGMLVHQAGEALRIWTGSAPPLDAMRRAGEQFIRGA